MDRPDPLAMTRRADRPAAGPTTGPMLKRLKQANRPALVSGSRPDRFDRPARSGFKNIGNAILNITLMKKEPKIKPYT
ncbi:hypothetical protein HanIR_Chr14g0675021 [Helianthus annuus]|nr:hypothetical protein HanIR_Chr14g0675021 [Helianthus annuus]